MRMVNCDNEKIISVIIPVYNGVKYLPECMESIFAQTYQGFEIILVDDGSEDESFILCQKYEKDYPGIVKAVKKGTNSGIAETLNLGMMESNGDYYFIISQDDKVSADAFEKAYKIITSDYPDIILLNRESIVENSGKVVTYPCIDDDLLGKLDYEKKRRIIIHLVSVAAFVMIGFFKKEFIDGKELFYDNVAPEDISLFPIMIAEASSIADIKDSYYIYKIRDDSISHRKNSPLYLTIHKAALQLIENAKRRGLYNRYAEEFEYAFVVAYYYDSVFNQIARFDERNIELLRELSDYMRDNYPDYQKNKYVVNEFELWKRKLMQANDVDPYVLNQEFPDCDSFLAMVRNGEIKSKFI